MTPIPHFSILLIFEANEMTMLIGVYLSLSMRELSLPSTFQAAPMSNIHILLEVKTQMDDNQ